MGDIKEIGSDFYEYDACQARRDKLWFEKDYEIKYLKSGRNAIKAVSKIIDKKRVLLPAYTCETVIQPFIDRGYELAYYSLQKDLTINLDDFTQRVRDFVPDVIVVHSYFGFDTLAKAEQKLKSLHEDGIMIVEDITQSIFSGYHLDFADYYVSSLRKFFAIPDGGVVITKNKLDFNEGRSDENIESVARQAFELKKTYFSSENKEVDELSEMKDRFREKYVELQNLISINEDIRRISPLSLQIYRSIDLDKIRKRRIANYNLLFEDLKDSDVVRPVLEEVVSDCVPLYFPVYVNEDRSTLQKFMAERRIYCPIIWRKPDILSDYDDAETNYIYDHILCIPIDQRYEIADMNKVVQAFSEYSHDNEKN